MCFNVWFGPLLLFDRNVEWIEPVSMNWEHRSRQWIDVIEWVLGKIRWNGYASLTGAGLNEKWMRRRRVSKWATRRCGATEMKNDIWVWWRHACSNAFYVNEEREWAAGRFQVQCGVFMSFLWLTQRYFGAPKTSHNIYILLLVKVTSFMTK